MVKRIDARAHAAASPATVHALLRDGSTWPEWGTVESFTLERPGPDGGESVGAIRNFRTGRYLMREQIVEIMPDRRFSYALLAGLALRDYRADIDLTPAGDGTDIHWHTTFRAKVPGMGWLYRRALQRITEQFVQGLADRATTESAVR
jgi:Polyketide cyclase / dehydrase and lipid transport